jgi:hypothetical protein
VAGFAVGMIGLLLAGVTDRPARAQSRTGLDGSWTVNITGGTGTPVLPDWYRARVTFTPTGGLVATITDSQLTTGHGSWVRTGDRTFAVTILFSQFDGLGNFVGTLKARATLTLSGTAPEFTGDPYQFEFFDPDGNPTAFTGVGIAHGVRIGAEPLP